MRFTLLTYNIHKAVGVDRRYAPDRIVEVLRHHAADVVLLQEVDRHATRAQRADLASLLAARLDYPYRAVSMNVFRRHEKYGNATLSRFPIASQQNIDLSLRGRIRRGAQHTRVCVPVGEQVRYLEVFNIHLGLFPHERMTQARRLLATRDFAAVPDGRPCIIAGDTNDWRGLLLGRAFSTEGFHCASDRPHKPGWPIRTYPSYAPAGGLDKVFYRGPIRLIEAHRSRLNLARLASDHLPLMVEFSLTSAAAAESS